MDMAAYDQHFVFIKKGKPVPPRQPGAIERPKPRDDTKFEPAFTLSRTKKMLDAFKIPPPYHFPYEPEHQNEQDPLARNRTPAWKYGEMMPRAISDRQGILEGKAMLLGTLNEMRTCPYNESHRVSSGRFHNHLTLCREANPDRAVFMIICPYDRTHHIEAEVFGMHLQSCLGFAAAHGNTASENPTVGDKEVEHLKYSNEVQQRNKMWANRDDIEFDEIEVGDDDMNEWI